MCGILGHLAIANGTELLEGDLLRLNDLMTHRGPTSAGHFCEGPVGLAMRRLAIIDLTTGDQPMISADGRYVMVYNGEVYNYAELRGDLEAAGQEFRTTSDTETLLNAYVAEGPACLQRLNGMFAVAIWDREERTLFLARDRLGVKPLYYAHDGQRFMFASELTPIQRSGLFESQIDLRAVSDLLAYWYICEPKTILRSVSQLAPGHYAIVRDGQMKIERWWTLPSEPAQDIGFDEATEELTFLLKDSIRLRLRSDVPLGTLLSGGIDSGLVTALAQQQTDQTIKSFSIGFKEKTYSELELASESANRLSVELITDTMGAISADQIDQILKAIDEPLGNASLIPSYLLFKLARQHVPVVLTGDGGDELFGGYPTYQAPYFRRLYHLVPSPLRAPLRTAVHRIPVSHARISLDYRLKRFLDGVGLPLERGHASWREVLGIDRQQSLFRDSVWQELDNHDPFEAYVDSFRASRNMAESNRLMHADCHTYLLNDHLRKVDRMSMLNSVEAREPMLDYRLVKFAMALPPEHKVSFRRTKRILKAASARLLPRSVVSGAKKGLTPPIPSWVADDLKDYVDDQLHGGLLAELFEPKALDAVLRAHRERRQDNSRLLWALVSLQAWAQGSGYVS